MPAHAVISSFFGSHLPSLICIGQLSMVFFAFLLTYLPSLHMFCCLRVPFSGGDAYLRRWEGKGLSLRSLPLYRLCLLQGRSPPHPPPGRVPSSQSLPRQYLTVTPVLRSVLIYCLARKAVCGPPGRLQLWCRASYIPRWMPSPRLRAPWGPLLHLARPWFRGTLSPLLQRGCVRDKQSLEFVAAREIDNRGETFFPCEALNCTDCTAFLSIS